MIQYFYRFWSIKSYHKMMATISAPYKVFLFLSILYTVVCVSNRRVCILFPGCALLSLLWWTLVCFLYLCICFALYIHLYYFFDSTFKWHNTVFVLLWLISLGIILSMSIHVASSGKIQFILTAQWDSIVCTYPSSLSIHLLMGTCITSVSWQLSLIVLWTLGYKYFFKLEFLYFLNIYQGVEFWIIW